MKHRTRILSIVISAAGLLLLILDAKSAASGAADGLDICMRVVLPSLFPFFVITNYMNTALMGLPVPGLRSIGRLLHFPAGGESLLLLGLIGGYPVGAQLVADAWKNGQLDRRTCQILLGYCSNAGPAFIFGVTAVLFPTVRIPLILWAVHIFSALLTGFMLPRPEPVKIRIPNSPDNSLIDALNRSLRICASVCGWIILFKILMEYLNTWLSNILSKAVMIQVCGILELSNGCLGLTGITSEAERFILCAAFLSFGGLCVLMQTSSVVKPLGLGLYIPGKLMQTAINILAASILVYFLYPGNATHNLSRTLFCLAVLIGAKIYAEKSCGNSKRNTV